MQIPRQKARNLRLVIFDVDGVLTNGSLILGEKGEEYKVFHVHDGLGLVMLREAGIDVAVISARSTPVVAERMAALGIDYVYQGQNNKLTALEELRGKLDVTMEETAYVGDDLVDIPVMSRVGLAIAVANARPEVRDRADWITASGGGHGAAREICEMILGAQDKLEAAMKQYIDD